MDAFKDYLIAEYRDRAKEYVATEFKFTHANTIKLDKPSKRHIKVDVIKVSVKLFDKDLHLLHTGTITFENNIIPKSKADSLINISPKELENRFAAAKRDICKVIMDELSQKKSDILLKIDNLNSFIGSSGIISTEFKGEVINVLEEKDEPKTKPKQSFEM